VVRELLVDRLAQRVRRHQDHAVVLVDREVGGTCSVRAAEHRLARRPDDVAHAATRAASSRVGREDVVGEGGRVRCQTRHGIVRYDCVDAGVRVVDRRQRSEDLPVVGEVRAQEVRPFVGARAAVEHDDVPVVVEQVAHHRATELAAAARDDDARHVRPP
jgi:hypothetical protein